MGNHTPQVGQCIRWMIHASPTRVHSDVRQPIFNIVLAARSRIVSATSTSQRLLAVADVLAPKSPCAKSLLAALTRRAAFTARGCVESHARTRRRDRPQALRSFAPPSTIVRPCCLTPLRSASDLHRAGHLSQCEASVLPWLSASCDTTGGGHLVSTRGVGSYL